jgi:hypothetical protein
MIACMIIRLQLELLFDGLNEDLRGVEGVAYHPASVSSRDARWDPALAKGTARDGVAASVAEKVPGEGHEVTGGAA